LIDSDEIEVDLDNLIAGNKARAKAQKKAANQLRA